MKIFVSYARADRELADEFTTALRHAGMDAGRWEDSAIRAGGDFEESLRHAMESVDVVVPILSDQALRSPSVMFELGAAKGVGKQVIPIRIHQEGISAMAPLKVGGEPSIDAESVQEAVDQLQQRIAGKAVSV